MFDSRHASTLRVAQSMIAAGIEEAAAHGEWSGKRFRVRQITRASIAQPGDVDAG